MYSGELLIFLRDVKCNLFNLQLSIIDVKHTFLNRNDLKWKLFSFCPHYIIYGS